MIFSSRLLWTTCIDNLCSKASKLISRIRSLCKRYDEMDPKILFSIFDVKIKPLLLYGCEVWGVKVRDQVEKTHVRFCKTVLNVGRTTPNCLAQSECGRYHLFVTYHLRAIKYWSKLLVMDERRYASKCYKQCYIHDQNGRCNWASDIRKLLNSLGFGFAWFYQSIGNKQAFLSQVKQRLCDISQQELSSNIRRFSPEYFDFHPTIAPAPYLITVQSHRVRRFLALLRTYSLPIKK